VTNLERRLKKLEALRTDSSALVPYSPQWFEYWDDQICFGLTGREAKSTRQLPPIGSWRFSGIRCRAPLVNTIPESND
jgi:hypothetical protein